MIGVLHVGDSKRSPFVTGFTDRGSEASFEEFLECAGGVGGRSIDPIILRDVCFSVRGLAFIEVADAAEGVVISVSKLSPRDALEEVA